MTYKPEYEPLNPDGEDCLRDAEAPSPSPPKHTTVHVGWIYTLVALLALNLTLCLVTTSISSKLQRWERVHDVHALPRPDPFVGLPVAEVGLRSLLGALGY